MQKLKHKKKIALVLSGGGVKAAAFHVGVCMALEEKGFKFVGGTHEQVQDNPNGHDPMAIKTYVGSSAGAFMSAMLASGHTIADIVDSFQIGAGLASKPSGRRSRLRPINYFDIFSANTPTLAGITNFLFKKKSIITGGLEAALKNNFKVNGLFTTKSLENYLRKQVLPTNSFAELGVEFFAIATHLNYSRKAIFGPVGASQKNPEIHYHNDVSISDAVAASMSLPPAFAPYSIKNKKGENVYYFDGEIRETLSTHVAKDMGADLIISSYSIQPYEYNAEVGSLSQFGLPMILNQALYQVVEQKIARSIQAREDIRTLIRTVAGYFKENDLPVEHAERLVEIMSRKVGYKEGVDYIYIHPKSQNYEMFFVDHFSLNPEILARIVKIGFKSAINVMRKYDV